MTLEIDANESFVRAERRVQRAGRVAIAVFVVGGLVGLLGVGPLNSGRASSQNGVVTVEFGRVIHHEADTSLTLVFGADAVEDGAILATVTGGWVSGVDLQGVSPEPSEQSAVPGGVVFEFAVAEAGETTATLTFRAQDYGSLDMDVAVGSDSVHLTQFVLP
jgi:hypothetical protein